MYALGNALRPRLCRAFTLVEMLIVIAIIALLAAILLPALRRAIKEGHEVVCMNNIRQLCVAATTYKEDYYGDYPPPVIFPHPPSTTSRVHPECLRASDIGFIAPYIGEEPSRFSDSTELTEAQYPRVLRCPFALGAPPNSCSPGGFSEQPSPGVNLKGESILKMYRLGYSYFGMLEWRPPGYGSFTYVPVAFKRKYASRDCDPDAALWGDTVSWQSWGGYPSGGYTHTYSGRPRYIWDGPNSVVFGDFERQNLGRADGSVIIRWPSDVNPDPSGAGVGAGLTWGPPPGNSYFWWYY